MRVMSVALEPDLHMYPRIRIKDRRTEATSFSEKKAVRKPASGAEARKSFANLHWQALRAR